MSTPTYTLINQVALAATSSEVTFSSIPATYADLVIVFNGGAVTGQHNILLALNADATDANFSGVMMAGSGSAATSTALVSGEARLINYFGFLTADLNTVIKLDVFDYAQTNKQKTYLSRSNNSGNGTTAIAGRWANTAAINSVRLSASGSAFRIGSTFSLYGIVG